MSDSRQNLPSNNLTQQEFDSIMLLLLSLSQQSQGSPQVHDALLKNLMEKNLEVNVQKQQLSNMQEELKKARDETESSRKTNSENNLKINLLKHQLLHTQAELKNSRNENESLQRTQADKNLQINLLIQQLANAQSANNALAQLKEENQTLKANEIKANKKIAKLNKKIIKKDVKISKLKADQKKRKVNSNSSNNNVLKNKKTKLQNVSDSATPNLSSIMSEEEFNDLLSGQEMSLNENHDENTNNNSDKNDYPIKMPQTSLTASLSPVPLTRKDSGQPISLFTSPTTFFNNLSGSHQINLVLPSPFTSFRNNNRTALCSKSLFPSVLGVNESQESPEANVPKIN